MLERHPVPGPVSIQPLEQLQENLLSHIFLALAQGPMAPHNADDQRIELLDQPLRRVRVPRPEAAETVFRLRFVVRHASPCTLS